MGLGWGLLSAGGSVRTFRGLGGRPSRGGTNVGDPGGLHSMTGGMVGGGVVVTDGGGGGKLASKGPGWQLLVGGWEVAGRECALRLRGECM